jgi:branched-chain amino acid transport system ATP-binding protein
VTGVAAGRASVPGTPVLAAENLSRRFGGLAAVDGVSLAVAMGEVHAVIGPNGAGKSTLVSLLSGDLAPSGGRIRLDGHDVTRLGPERRSHLGLGRSYQKTNVFLPFTVFENCRLAAQSRQATSMRFLRPASSFGVVNAAAGRALAAAGLEARRDARVETLSHGEQRQVEIAMALATRPRVLLLDEPLAGMGAEESAGMVALLRRLRPDHAMVLVEHDMDAVFALADTLTVMANGRVIASGPPATVREHPEVRRAYLGDESHA